MRGFSSLFFCLSGCKAFVEQNALTEHRTYLRTVTTVLVFTYIGTCTHTESCLRELIPSFLLSDLI